MLDQVTIFNKNGVVLWSQTWAALRSDPVHAVIHSILLEVCARR